MATAAQDDSSTVATELANAIAGVKALKDEGVFAAAEAVLEKAVLAEQRAVAEETKTKAPEAKADNDDDAAPKSCVTDFCRNVWTSYYETDVATHGRGVQMAAKCFKVPAELLGSKDFEEDLVCLRRYFDTCEMQPDGQIKLGTVLNGQFIRARHVAQLSLVFNGHQMAIHVLENAAVHRETIFWYLKPKGDAPADWKKAKPADAVVVREHEVPAKLSALLRDWRRRYSALSWLGTNITWSMAALAGIYGETQPKLPRQVLCLDTASDVFGHLWNQNLMIAITNAVVVDLDRENAAAVARRNAPLYALLVTFATNSKPRPATG